MTTHDPEINSSMFTFLLAEWNLPKIRDNDFEIHEIYRMLFHPVENIKLKHNPSLLKIQLDDICSIIPKNNFKFPSTIFFLSLELSRRIVV